MRKVKLITSKYIGNFITLVNRFVMKSFDKSLKVLNIYNMQNTFKIEYKFLEKTPSKLDIQRKFAQYQLKSIKLLNIEKYSNGP